MILNLDPYSHQVTTLETYPQIINFDVDVLNYFKTQYIIIYLSIGFLPDPVTRQHLCNYDLNLTYPQNGTFPSLVDPRDVPASFFESTVARSKGAMAMKGLFARNYAAQGAAADLTIRDLEAREEKRQLWKRDLSGRPNGTLDPHYGCFIFEEMLDYALNFSFPWSTLLTYSFSSCHTDDTCA